MILTVFIADNLNNKKIFFRDKKIELRTIRPRNNQNLKNTKSKK